jgi:hypothetical protein
MRCNSSEVLIPRKPCAPVLRRDPDMPLPSNPFFLVITDGDHKRFDALGTMHDDTQWINKVTPGRRPPRQLL